MTEKELLDRFRSEKPLYSSYGELLIELISNKAKEQLIPSHWFVIEPSFRVKDESSFIEKAFYRNKNYRDPYNDITDKVGIRFILLTTDQVTKFTCMIEEMSNLIIRKDRDYEKEQELNPTTFIYQSMHYVVSLKEPVIYNGVNLDCNLFCEIQIRTLLQHAYSELTHDTIYKPKTIAEPRTHRLVARSMALIETTDSIFSEVGKQVSTSKCKSDIIINSIVSEYSSKLDFQLEEKLNYIILDIFDEKIPSLNVLIEYTDSKPFIITKIKEKSITKLLFRQPIVILIYYFISKFPNETLKLWPLTAEEIEVIYSDLGIRMPVL